MISKCRWLSLFIFLSGMIGSALYSRPAVACEIAIPPNYLFEEAYELETNTLPAGVVFEMAAPDENDPFRPAGLGMLVNQGSSQVKLLYADELIESFNHLTAGQLIDPLKEEQGYPLNPGESIAFYGEQSFAQFDPDLQIVNLNDWEGQNNPSGDLPPAQTVELYLVADQLVHVVPVTISYRPHPTYKPEGTFHTVTLDEKIAAAPAVVLGTAVQEAGYGGQKSTTLTVEQWLKGSGGREIKVSGFGETSCDYQIEAGGRRVFFLTPINDGYQLLEFQAGLFDAINRPEDAGQITAIIGQPPSAPVDDSLQNEALGGPSNPFDGRNARPWLMGGVGLGLSMLLGLFFIKRKRL